MLAGPPLMEVTMNKRCLMIGLGLALAACSGGDPNAPGNEDTGEVTLSVINAPPDASCLQVQAVGGRSVTKSFDLIPGQQAVFTLNGLALGPNTFTEQAFASSCAAVTASSVATWLSDPAIATLQAGVVTNLTVVLHRNGQVVITSDFQDDPGGSCSPAGGPCATAADCCSGNNCTGGVCTPGCGPGLLQSVVNGQLACVDVLTDVNNCGACGVVCPAPTVCSAGVCSGAATPQLSLAANILQFPPTPLFSISPPQVVNGFNSGSALLTIQQLIVIGPNAPDYLVQAPVPLAVSPGQGFSIPVQFRPTVPGPSNAMLQIFSNDPASPANVTLQGTGL
jgi:hypothetical protein